MNPYELGQHHAKSGQESQNPYPEFSGEWALYNRGFNKIQNPWMTSEKS